MVGTVDLGNGEMGESVRLAVLGSSQQAERLTFVSDVVSWQLSA